MFYSSYKTVICQHLQLLFIKEEHIELFIVVLNVVERPRFSLSYKQFPH